MSEPVMHPGKCKSLGCRVCRLFLNSGFAPPEKSRMVHSMENPAQAIEDARRAGIDLDLLDSNLALSVKERWRLHNEALNLAMKLREAAERRDAKLQSTARTAR